MPPKKKDSKGTPPSSSSSSDDSKEKKSSKSMKSAKSRQGKQKKIVSHKAKEDGRKRGTSKKRFTLGRDVQCPRIIVIGTPGRLGERVMHDMLRLSSKMDEIDKDGRDDIKRWTGSSSSSKYVADAYGVYYGAGTQPCHIARVTPRFTSLDDLGSVKGLFPKADGFIVFFDMSQPSSLNDAFAIKNAILKTARKEANLALLGILDEYVGDRCAIKSGSALYERIKKASGFNRGYFEERITYFESLCDCDKGLTTRRVLYEVFPTVPLENLLRVDSSSA